MPEYWIFAELEINQWRLMTVLNFADIIVILQIKSLVLKIVHLASCCL